MNGIPAKTHLERQVLGYCLLRQQHIDAARGSIELEDFSLQKNQLVWRRICELYDAGKDVDHITVYHALIAGGESEQAGWISDLMSMEDGLPERPHIEAYVEKLRESSIRRRAIFACQHLMNQATDDTQDIHEAVAAHSERMVSIAQSTGESSGPVSTAELLEKHGITGILSPRRHNTIRLPWSRLDEALKGVGAGQMIVLMAGTGSGKTSAALQAAMFSALQGFVPVMWTMEMPMLSLYQRMVNQVSGVSPSRFLTFEERTARGEAAVKIGETPMYFDQHSRNVGSFLATLRHVKSKHKLGLAVVDHLQLIRPSNGKNRAQEVSDNSRALKLASLDLGIPFLVLSQVDRSSVKGEGKIGLHSAKESGDVENDADVVLWFDSVELSREQDTLVPLHVGKQREGPSGFSIPMVFRPKRQTFEEIPDENR